MRRGLPRRSRAEWGVRGGLALLAIMSAYGGVRHSMALVMQRTDAARAHALAPYDGRITAALAEKLFAADPKPDANGETAQLALRQDPTVVKAVATLGLQAQLRGDVTAARGLFAYAQRLSRRDLQTQIWAIEDAIARGGIAATLRHYDIALRTSNEAPELLFPVLGDAIGEPDVRRNLVGTLARRPLWETAFVDHVANAGADPEAVARLFIDLRRAGVAVSAEATRAATTRLIQAGSAELAWRYYAMVRAPADRRVSRDQNFSARLEVPSPFDWVVVNESGMAASIEPAAEGGLVDFAAPPGVGGEVVRQMQLLPPGRYRIEGRTRNIDQPAGSAPYWSLTCWQGRELGRVAVPGSAQADGAFAGFFVAPADCPVQMLAFVTRASDTIAGVSGQLERVRLAPAP